MAYPVDNVILYHLVKDMWRETPWYVIHYKHVLENPELAPDFIKALWFRHDDICWNSTDIERLMICIKTTRFR